MAQSLTVSEADGSIGLVRLNREDALNALSPQMFGSICEAVETFDEDPQIRVIVLTGNERVFAAGADIQVMAEATALDIVELDTIRYWQRLERIRKPVIAAVSGYAFGGGCELAMQCDLIVASESAQFAQSEIRVGIMPGAGGTQRLVKALGPYRAMEMVLTGEPLSASEAVAFGLVNRVVPVERYLEEAIHLARKIAERAPFAVRLAKDALRRGVETTLREGLRNERRNFYLSFESADKNEGMQAFLEKRPPEFKGR